MTSVDVFPRYRYRGEVTRVIDGDTIEIELDLGFHIYHRVRIRVLGYDAPELFSGSDKERKQGAVWRDWLIEIFKLHGQTTYVRTERDRTSFGRYLGYVYVVTEDDQLVDIKDLLLAADEEDLP